VETINDILAALDAIVDQSRDEASRLGYFAALYRGVTRSVKNGIAAGRFAGAARMEKLDVTFARRYLDSYGAFQAGQPVPRSWSIAFRACADSRPCVLQHLLAGMNAHINLDLGIAAAEVAPGAALEALHSDFNEINNVLAEDLVGVEGALSEISPVLHLLSDAALLDRNRILNFDMTEARNLAWSTAQRLAAGPIDRDAIIASLDAAVALLGNAIVHPPAPIALQLVPIRAVEIPDVRRTIDALAAASAA
jgi:hypothetical protein